MEMRLMKEAGLRSNLRPQGGTEGLKRSVEGHEGDAAEDAGHNETWIMMIEVAM